MARNQITTIDIGTNSVKILQLGLTQTGLNVINFGLAKLPRQTSAEKVSDEVIVDTLSSLVKDRGFNTRHVVISVPRHLVTVKSLGDLPASATEEEISKMVPIQVEPELPLAISEATYSIYNLQRSEDRVSLEVVAAKKSSIERYINITEKAGIKLTKIIPSAFATYALIFDQYKDQLVGKTIALADIGAGGTDICILQHGRLAFSRSFTLGGNNLTQMYEKEHDISFDDAEEKKIKEANLNPSFEDTLTAYWAEELATRINQSIKAFVGQDTNGKIDGLWLCGGGSKILDLDIFLSDKLGIETTKCELLKGIDTSLFESEMSFYSDCSSVGLGLAIIGMAGEDRVPTVDVNLLPIEIIERAQRIRQRFLMIIAGIAGAVFIVAVGLGFYGWHRSRLAAYEKAEKQIKALESEVVTRHAKESLENSILMEKMMASYVTPLEVLREMSEKLPDRRKIALNNLSIDKSGKVTMGVEAASHADVGEMIQILSEMKIMDESKLFTEVKHGVISKVMKENRPILQVQIICTLNNQAMQETG